MGYPFPDLVRSLFFTYINITEFLGKNTSNEVILGYFCHYMFCFIASSSHVELLKVYQHHQSPPASSQQQPQQDGIPIPSNGQKESQMQQPQEGNNM